VTTAIYKRPGEGRVALRKLNLQHTAYLVSTMISFGNLLGRELPRTLISLFHSIVRSKHSCTAWHVCSIK